MKKLVVMILSYNHPEITKKCVQSVRMKFDDPSIYLVHNGSDLKNIDALKINFPNINHLAQEKNNGFTGGINFGFDHLFQISEWIFFITNDCILVDFEFQEQNIGMCAPLIYRRKMTMIDSIGGLFLPQKAKLIHCRDSQHFLSPALGYLPYIPGTSFLLHRQAWLQTGKFDESLHTYWEDVDYSQRLSSNGFKLELADNVRLIHSVGKTCHKKKFYTQFLYQRNRRLISRKYTKGIFKKIYLELQLSLEKLRQFKFYF